MSLGDIKKNSVFLRKEGLFENNQKIYCYLLVFDLKQEIQIMKNKTKQKHKT